MIGANLSGPLSSERVYFAAACTAGYCVQRVANVGTGTDIKVAGAVASDPTVVGGEVPLGILVADAAIGARDATVITCGNAKAIAGGVIAPTDLFLTTDSSGKLVVATNAAHMGTATILAGNATITVALSAAYNGATVVCGAATAFDATAVRFFGTVAAGVLTITANANATADTPVNYIIEGAEQNVYALNRNLGTSADGDEIDVFVLPARL